MTAPLAKHFLAIGSGKGGVGKSTVSVNLAISLGRLGHRVGLIDADIYGPNVPVMLNITRRRTARWLDLAWKAGAEASKWEPVETHGIKVMSVGFLIGEEQALWNAGLIEALSTQLVHRVHWGELDYLLADLPPGSADINQRFVQSMKVAGAILVVTPQDVAHLDAKKAVEMYRHAGVKVLGAVENMTALTCPHCKEPIEVFPHVREERSVWSMGVEKLADIPLDPRLSSNADLGRPIVDASPESIQAKAFEELAARIADELPYE